MAWPNGLVSDCTETRVSVMGWVISVIAVTVCPRLLPVLTARSRMCSRRFDETFSDLFLGAGRVAGDLRKK
jgi:hypothetical protein